MTEDGTKIVENEESHGDISVWAIDEGKELNEFEAKASDSLRRRRKIYELANSEIFDKYSGLNKFDAISIIFLVILSALLLFEVFIKFMPHFIEIVIETTLAIVSTLFIFKRIAEEKKYTTNVNANLGEIEQANGSFYGEKPDPSSFELLAQTFVPKLKDFMVATSAKSNQEHIKDLLKSALNTYGIYSENIGNCLRNLKKIYHTDSKSLEYMIHGIVKESELNQTLAYLAYYDFVSDPLAKDKLKEILNKKNQSEARELLINLVTTSDKKENKPVFGKEFYIKIATDILNMFLSRSEPYSIRAAQIEFVGVMERAKNTWETFIRNLDTFDILVDPKNIESWSTISLDVESIGNGTFFIEQLFSNSKKNLKGLNTNHLKLLYHYSDSELKRKECLSKLSISDMEFFANYIYKELLGINTTYDVEILGESLRSVGDYKIEGIERKIRNVNELREFLRMAKESLKDLGFHINSNIDQERDYKALIKRISASTDEKWMIYYFDYFSKLTDWETELQRIIPNYSNIVTNDFIKILFIVFSNGKLNFQPVLDKIELHRYYLRVDPNIENDLLQLTELSQKASVADIPKLIFDVLSNPIKSKDQYYKEQFHKAFITGSIPSYELLVNDSNRYYRARSDELFRIISADKTKENMLKKIVDEIFSLKLTDEFIKSMLVGGAINAYLIFKPTKDGILMEILKGGTKNPNNFETFLEEHWESLDRSLLPRDITKDNFYRVNNSNSGFSVLIGLVPEEMIFSDFSKCIDIFISSYISERKGKIVIKSETSDDNKIKMKQLDDTQWDILPIDITTIRNEQAKNKNNRKEEGYIESVQNVILRESLQKKLAWIGMIGNHGDISDKNNIRYIIKNIANQDELGFVRYMDIKTGYFESENEDSYVNFESKLRTNDEIRKRINEHLLKLLNSKTFIEACLTLGNKLEDKSNSYLKSELSKLKIKIDDINYKLSENGLKALAEQVNDIASSFLMLTAD